MWTVVIEFHEKSVKHREQIAHWFSQYGEQVFDFIPQMGDDPQEVLTRLRVRCPSDQREAMEWSLVRHVINGDIYRFSLNLFYREPFDEALIA